MSFAAIETILLSMESELSGVELTEDDVFQVLYLGGIHFQILAANSPFQSANAMDRTVKLWLLFKLWLITRLGLPVDGQSLIHLMKLIFEGMENSTFSVQDVTTLITSPTPLVASTPGQMASTELLLQMEAMVEGQVQSFDVPHTGLLIVQNLGNGQFLLILNNRLAVTTQNPNELQTIFDILFSFRLDNAPFFAQPGYMLTPPASPSSPGRHQSFPLVVTWPVTLPATGEVMALGSRLLMGTVFGIYVGGALNRVAFGRSVNNDIPWVFGLLIGQIALWSTPDDLAPGFTTRTQAQRAFARSLWRFLFWFTQRPPDAS